MSQARKIFSNTAWQILGKAATAILGIVSIKFITNYLSPSTYGEYTTIYDYTALFAIIADFGLFTIAVREMAHSNKKEVIEKIVGNVLSIRTALAILALGFGCIAAYMIPAYGESHIPYGVFIVSIATIMTLVAGTMSSVLQFYLRMHWASVGLTIGKLITVIYIVLTILYFFPKNPDAGFPHLLFAWIIGGLFTILITYRASSKLIHISYQFDFKFWKEVLVKALPYGLALVLGTIYFRMGTIVLSLLHQKEQVGYYGVPIRFLEILQIVPHYFMNSVLPILTVRLKNDVEGAARVVKYSLNSLCALALPILAGGFVLAWPLTVAVSSPEFITHRDAAGALIWGSDIGLKILLIAMAFTYFHVVLTYTLVAMGRQSELLWINAIAVVLNIALNMALSPTFGFIGATISVAVTEAVMLIILILRVRKRIKNIWDLPFVAKTAFSAAIMGGVLYFINEPITKLLLAKSLILLIPIGGVIFGASMLLTKAITKDMLALLKKSGEDATPSE